MSIFEQTNESIEENFVLVFEGQVPVFVVTRGPFLVFLKKVYVTRLHFMPHVGRSFTPSSKSKKKDYVLAKQDNIVVLLRPESMIELSPIYAYLNGILLCTRKLNTDLPIHISIIKLYTNIQYWKISWRHIRRILFLQLSALRTTNADRLLISI